MKWLARLFDKPLQTAMCETAHSLAVQSGTAGGRMNISDRGLALIKRFEGLARLIPGGKVEAYPDPGTGGEPWTIGYGATLIDGKAVQRGTIITLDRAGQLLLEDVERHANEVRRFLGNAPTTQGQFDAMVSFHFNTGKLPTSTLGRKHKAGDYAGSAEEFGKWKIAGGRVLKGLVRRREAERALYLS